MMQSSPFISLTPKITFLGYALIINTIHNPKEYFYIQKMPELIVLFNTLIPAREKKKAGLNPAYKLEEIMSIR